MQLIDEKTDSDQRVVMVRMNRSEALRTIESLACQLGNGSPNSGRFEKHCDCGADFSIAVHDEPERQESFSASRPPSRRCPP